VTHRSKDCVYLVTSNYKGTASFHRALTRRRGDWQVPICGKLHILNVDEAAQEIRLQGRKLHTHPHETVALCVDCLVV
jgi:hypothetical protein